MVGSEQFKVNKMGINGSAVDQAFKDVPKAQEQSAALKE